MKLKKCPFCGGPAEFGSNWSFKNKAWFVFARCSICYSQGHTYTVYVDPEDDERGDWEDAEGKAAAAWNMRAPEEER